MHGRARAVCVYVCVERSFWHCFFCPCLFVFGQLISLIEKLSPQTLQALPEIPSYRSYHIDRTLCGKRRRSACLYTLCNTFGEKPPPQIKNFHILGSLKLFPEPRWSLSKPVIHPAPDCSGFMSRGGSERRRCCRSCRHNRRRTSSGNWARRTNKRWCKTWHACSSTKRDHVFISSGFKRDRKEQIFVRETADVNLPRHQGGKYWPDLR